MKLTLALTAATITVSFLSALAALGQSGSAASDSGGNGVPSGASDDAASPSDHVEHLRLDDEAIERLGGGSMDAGLTALGKRGFRLFAVTTRGDAGAAGWHLWKRPPWNLPVPRPRFDYRRVDGAAVEQLGDGKFEPGMAKLEADRWEVVAVTQARDGGVGFYYLERPAAGAGGPGARSAVPTGRVAPSAPADVTPAGGGGSAGPRSALPPLPDRPGAAAAVAGGPAAAPPPAVPGAAAAAAGGAPAAGGIPPGVVRLARAAVRDPMSNNMVATTFLLPEGWQFEGGVEWRWNPYSAVASHSRVFNPRGPEHLCFYPSQLFYDGVRESAAQAAAVAGPLAMRAAAGGYPEGSYYQGFEVRTRVPDPVEATRQFILARYRPDLARLRPTSVGELPDVARALVAQAGGQQPGLQTRVVRIRFEYAVNGVAVEEEVRCTASAVPIGPLVHWSLDARSYRAAKGRLDATLPLLFAVERSAKADLNWFAGVMDVQRRMQEAGFQQIADAGMLSRYISRRTNEVNELIVGSYRESQRTVDATMDAFSQSIRGVERYRDPSDASARYDLPAGYDRAFVSPRGEVLLSTDPTYDPGVALHEDWRELPKATR